MLNKAESYTAPLTSLYHAFVHNIKKCMELGKEGGAMDVKVYVESVLNRTIGKGMGKVVVRRIPMEIVEGGGKMSHLILRWVPRSWYFSLIWKVLGQPEKKDKAK